MERDRDQITSMHGETADLLEFANAAKREGRTGAMLGSEIVADDPVMSEEALSRAQKHVMRLDDEPSDGEGGEARLRRRIDVLPHEEAAVSGEHTVGELRQAAVEQLMPERHPQHDLFICDVADAVLKDLMAQLEYPFYALSKKPEMTIRRYEQGDNWLEVRPSTKGLATIYDKDILIYCISQIMAAAKQGRPISPRVSINSRELLMFTNRGTSGREYIGLIDALDRLSGTRISTNIKSGGEEQYETFGLIDAASIRRKLGLDGRLMHCEVRLSDWVFNAIKHKEVLTLHRDYFRLRKPIERRIYEIARKHCGQQAYWKISLQNLLKKTGSQSPMKRFRQMVHHLVEHDHLPDYSVQIDERDMVMFVNRRESTRALKSTQSIMLDPECFAEARHVAPGWDIYHLEKEWRAWMAMGDMDPPRNPNKAFLGFCRKWYERHGDA